jgi:chromosome partitioning protein
MADEGRNGKRKGRRLFASRRRQAASTLSSSESGPEEVPAPDPVASPEPTVDLQVETDAEETDHSTDPVVGGSFTPPADSAPGRVDIATVVSEPVTRRARGRATVVEEEIVDEDNSVEPEIREPEVSESEERARAAAAAAPELGNMAPAAPMVLPAIVAIANQKGGVGKTTTAVNLGAALAELGHRVLVVDLDPQGNATTGLGINARDLQLSIYDVVMNEAAVEDCVEPTSLKNLFVAPATIDLAGAEIELVPAFSRELKLRRALEDVREQYDVTLIDCPPSLGLLTVNALAAADDVIVPIQCEYYALEGLGQLLRNVALVRTNLNQSLHVRGIVLTMYDARTKLAGQVEQEVRDHFGPKVYRAVVPRTVRLGEAPSFGQPIIVFDPTSRGAIAYRELAKEVCRGATRRSG